MAEKPNMSEELTGPILSTVLIKDVVSAAKRAESTNLESDRRDYVRALFAGVEGLIWFLKLQVTSGHGHGLLKSAEMDALFERGWTVTDKGDIREVPRFLPTSTSIKLLVKTIQKLDPDYKVDFQHPGWQKLKRAIEVRNRLVHPKRIEDLVVTSEDMVNCTAGFHWVLALVIEGKQSAIAFLEERNGELATRKELLTLREKSIKNAIDPTR